MSERRYSGFAQFADRGKCDRFVRTVLDGNAELARRAHVSCNRATIVFENLTSAEQKRIVSALEGIGRWFEDVQFKTME
jgi:hypothetical protein